MRTDMQVPDEQVQQLRTAISATLPEPWPEPPRGWRDEAEAALIDAVFSARAQYGKSESTGVRRIVALWRCDRSEHGVAQLDDLNELTACDPVLLADLFENHQTVPAKNGMTKAAAIVEAAKALVAAGYPSSTALVAGGLTGPAADAYMSVRGLGKQTWNYLMMLLGVPGVKADTMVCRYVNAAVATDQPLGPEHCGALVLAAAQELEADPIQLDHTIWLYQRAQ